MEKKEYTAPVLTLLGDVEDLTKGEGLRGRDDQWWFVSYNGRRGGPKQPNDPTSGR